MRSMWKGSLGFGMVAIPVKLYGATDDKKVSLNQLHAECGTRIKMPKYCMIAHIKFLEYTNDGRLRFPSYKGEKV